jgi:membrane protein
MTAADDQVTESAAPTNLSDPASSSRLCSVEMNGPHTIRHLTVETVQEFLQDRCSVMAAALAYYALFAMPALLFAGVYAAGEFYGRQAAEGRLQAQSARLLGPSAASAIHTMIAGTANGARSGTIAALTAFGGLTYSALAAAYELQQSLNQAWDVRVDASGSRSFVLKRVYTVFLIIAAMILLIASLAALPTLSAFKSEHSGLRHDVLHSIEIVFSWSLCAILLAVMMKVLPDAAIEWRDVWLGAAVTSALMLLGRFLITLYLAHANFSNAYGALGSIAALLLWAYYCSAILMLGVEFTRVWAREHGRQIQPERGAVRIEVIERIAEQHDSNG